MSWDIPLSELEYGPEEEEAVMAVLRSRWLTMGERTAAFEEAFAQVAGTRFAVGVSNCTVALHLGLLCLGVGPGDEVIVPDLTFIAGVNAVRYTGAVPVLADVTSERDLTLSAEDVVAKITPRTKAVMVMHYGGYPCDMEAIAQVARSHGLAIVEDAAHAPGAEYCGRPAGSLGEVAAFSFFSNKNMASGEGGMLTTNDEAMARRARLLRSHCMTLQTLDRHKGHAYTYDVVLTGYNYRISEMEAALGLAQLRKLPAFNRARADLVREYQARLAPLSGVEVPFLGYGEPGSWPFPAKSSHHLMVILLPDETTRSRVIEGLRAHRIQSSIHYPPVHGFSNIQEEALAGRVKVSGLETVSALAPRLLSLPLSPSYGPQVAERVAAVIQASL